VLYLVREAVKLFHKQHPNGGVPTVFQQPDADLEARVRVHAFLPRHPHYKPQVKLRKREHGVECKHHKERQTNDREGGRLHGHTDEGGTKDAPGTDGVVVLNLGSCDSFVDSTETSKGQRACQAQLAKEVWCVGLGDGANGHMVRRYQVVDRYRYEDGKLGGRLSEQRLCSECAEGRQGTSCQRCLDNTLRLNSGDVVVLNGTQTFHGISRIVREEAPPPRDLPGTPPLPQWAQQSLDEGFRLSVQWRLSNAASIRAKAKSESEQFNAYQPRVDWDPQAGAWLPPFMRLGNVPGPPSVAPPPTATPSAPSSASPPLSASASSSASCSAQATPNAAPSSGGNRPVPSAAGKRLATEGMEEDKATRARKAGLARFGGQT
jgi:hypothetical protein